MTYDLSSFKAAASSCTANGLLIQKQLQIRKTPKYIKRQQQFKIYNKQQEIEYGEQEKQLDVSSFLREFEDNDFIFDDNLEEDIYVGEKRIGESMSAKREGEKAQKYGIEKDTRANNEEKPVISAYSSEGGFKEMGVSEFRIMKQSFDIIIDVRENAEYIQGYVPDAQSIPLDSISEQIKSGDLNRYKDKRVAVICQMGGRSAQASVRLTKVFNFSNVTTITGGTQAWINAGYSVDKLLKI